METSNNSLGDVLLGAAVVATAIGFFVYAVNVSGFGNTSVDGNRVLADFESVDGISVGTDVRLAGIKVGSVSSLVLNKESFQASVEMSIDKGLSLADDSSAKISSDGLLGGKYIVIEPGGSDIKIIAGGAIQNTQGAIDIWSLISQAMFDKGKASGSAQ